MKLQEANNFAAAKLQVIQKYEEKHKEACTALEKIKIHDWGPTGLRKNPRSENERKAEQQVDRSRNVLVDPIDPYRLTQGPYNSTGPSRAIYNVTGVAKLQNYPTKVNNAVVAGGATSHEYESNWTILHVANPNLKKMCIEQNWREIYDEDRFWKEETRMDDGEEKEEREKQQKVILTPRSERAKTPPPPSPPRKKPKQETKQDKSMEQHKPELFGGPPNPDTMKCTVCGETFRPGEKVRQCRFTNCNKLYHKGECAKRGMQRIRDIQPLCNSHTTDEDMTGKISDIRESREWDEMYEELKAVYDRSKPEETGPIDESSDEPEQGEIKFSSDEEEQAETEKEEKPSTAMDKNEPVAKLDKKTLDVINEKQHDEGQKGRSYATRPKGSSEQRTGSIMQRAKQGSKEQSSKGSKGTPYAGQPGKYLGQPGSSSSSRAQSEDQRGPIYSGKGYPGSIYSGRAYAEAAERGRQYSESPSRKQGEYRQPSQSRERSGSQVARLRLATVNSNTNQCRVCKRWNTPLKPIDLQPCEARWVMTDSRKNTKINCTCRNKICGECRKVSKECNHRHSWEDCA